MGVLNVLDSSGDHKVVWDPENEDEVEVAEMSFDQLIDKGFKAYKANKKGERGREIKKFNPDLGKIIMVPQIAGG